MRILVESAKKGLKIAAISMMSISEYIKNINKITMRLRDMLAEIVSDMKSNMGFLAPLLSGVVVGLAAMITSILTKLDSLDLAGEGASVLGGLSNIIGPDGIFQFTNMIPPYFLQIIIGIYLVQMIFILTKTLVIIDSGEDKLVKTNKTGKNLTKGIMLYFVVAILAILALFILTNIVLGNLV
jgi:flagellar biosynthesis protein FlhB